MEIYYTAPYTNGGIEKAAANLIAFEKTDSIEPGESQTKSFTINKEDMASYDSECIKISGGGYILEAGEYHNFSSFRLSYQFLVKRSSPLMKILINAKMAVLPEQNMLQQISFED